MPDIVDSVLIVGGGLGGLTLAAALAREGIPAELVERSADWSALGAGIAVQGNGLRVLRELGMDAAVYEAGAVLHRWIFSDDQGTVLSESDLDDLWSGAGPCIGISRTRLQDVLVRGASAVPSRLGTSIVSLVEHDDGVSVDFTDGTAGCYRLVVGADGIHSAVRAHVVDGAAPVFAGQIVWRSLSPVRLAGLQRVQFCLGDGCFFGLCSVGDDHTYGFGNVTQERYHEPVEGRLERLRARFGGFGPAVQDFLAGLQTDEQIHCSPIEWIELEEWHTERIVLIGDAGHATSPMMGQGGCLAMEDALVLAETLRSEATVPSALRAFASRRRLRVQWVQEQSRAVAEALGMPSEVRNPVLRERGDAMLRQRFAPLTEQP